jgi:integrase
MPASSGIDPPEHIRLSENYFRLVRREWQPRSIDDPEFPGRVYAAGERHGWALREVCVARTLLESGARISEIFDLTAADWSVSSFGNHFSARSKGSFGQRVKTLVISNPTAKLYRRYFDQCRRHPADEPLTVSALSKIQKRDPEQLPLIRIFLTQRGTPMAPGLFRDHYWRPALRSAGIEADPHTCRHWFVTNAMRHIEQAAAGEVSLARHKQELIQYMAWRSGDRTLKAYEHLERGRSFAARLQAIHREMGKRERRSTKDRVEETGNVAASGNGRDLAYLLGDDDDD